MVDLVVRRKALVEKSDYLQGVEWVFNKFINATGTIRDSDLLKYTDTLIFVPKGTYAIVGHHTTNNVCALRVHRYNESGSWIEQITAGNTDAGNKDALYYEFTITDDCYIRISIVKTFEGVLKKVS